MQEMDQLALSGAEGWTASLGIVFGLQLVALAYFAFLFAHAVMPSPSKRSPVGKEAGPVPGMGAVPGRKATRPEVGRPVPSV